MWILFRPSNLHLEFEKFLPSMGLEISKVKRADICLGKNKKKFEKLVCWESYDNIVKPAVTLCSSSTVGNNIDEYKFQFYLLTSSFRNAARSQNQPMNARFLAGKEEQQHSMLIIQTYL